jgi:RHS repeat-associated protein
MDVEYRYTTGQNNGRITQAKDWISGEEVSYAYDSLQRLISAQTTGPEWGNAFSYDGFGNLTGKTVTKGSAPLLAQAYDPATNRPVGQSFDLNGNAQVGTWDIENRLVSQTLDGQAIQWGYDHNGKRVMRYETVNGQPKYTFYIYGLSGEKLAQISCTYDAWRCSTGIASDINEYFGGRLIARDGQAIVTDRLGSVRATKTGGGTWTQTNYYAWGEEKSPVSPDGKTKYATYTRDSTLSGQDYADQRYYSMNMGRFFSPDPSGSVDLNKPTSWNQYAYTSADPVNFNDRRGLNLAWVAGPGDGDMAGGFGWDGPYYQGYLTGDPETPWAYVVVPPPPPASPPAAASGGVGGGNGKVTTLGDAKGALLSAITELGENCRKVLPSEQQLRANANDITFYDARPEASGGLTVAQINSSLAPYNPTGNLSSMLSGNGAVILYGPPNGTTLSISNTVLLGANFFAASWQGNNANFAVGQATFLIHELLHYSTQMDDEAFVRGYGITHQDQYESNSSAISRWLQNDCK